MFKYITLSTDKDEFRVSSLIVSKKDEKLKFDMPSLEILIDGEVTESWNSEPYLIEEVYPYLKGEKENEELDEIFSTYKEEILEIFEEAFSLGIFTKKRR